MNNPENTNPGQNFEREAGVFDERHKRITERLVALENLVKERGLSSEFIHNVIGNILSAVGPALEIFSEEPDMEMRTIVEEGLDLAEKYLDTLNKNEDALKEESSMDFETWIKMGQQESNHAREIIKKYE